MRDTTGFCRIRCLNSKHTAEPNGADAPKHPTQKGGCSRSFRLSGNTQASFSHGKKGDENMNVASWARNMVIAGCLIVTCGCATNGRDVNTAIAPNPVGNGVMAQVEIEFTSVSEIPGKLLKGLGDAMVSITQPIHPYHYVRNDQGRIVTNHDGKPEKVWLPFWRIIGKHHGDSVAGIVYDHGWLGGWKERPGDKLGKAAGLALLIWGSSELMDDPDKERGSESLEVDHCSEIESDDYEYEPGPSVPNVTLPQNPVSPPEVPPVVDPVLEWGDGEGGPVGM